MWHYGGMDVPFVDPTLINTNYGLGTWNYGLTHPFFGTPKFTYGDYSFENRFEMLPLGGFGYGTTPFGTTPFVNTLGYTPFVNTFGTTPFTNSFVNPLWKTTTNPIFGWNNTLPTTWGSPIGFDRLNLMKLSLGHNPWFVNSIFGGSPAEELYKSTYNWTMPYLQTLPYTNTLGLYGTPYGINTTINPFFLNGIEDKLKFQTPFTNGSFGLFNTFNTFNTPIDWKVKSFGTPVGMTTETWSKPIGFPWKPSVISGPVAVL